MELKPVRSLYMFWVIFFSIIFLPFPAAGQVVREKDKTYLVDLTSERWDISQAVSIGYDPYQFEFGIGRHAFTPLSDTDWSSKSEGVPSRMRVIGVAGNQDAHAYSVEKLRYHETANTFLGEQAIVTGY